MAADTETSRRPEISRVALRCFSRRRKRHYSVGWHQFCSDYFQTHPPAPNFLLYFFSHVKNFVTQRKTKDQADLEYTTSEDEVGVLLHRLIVNSAFP